MKRHAALVLMLVAVVMLISGCVSKGDHDDLQTRFDTLTAQYDALQAEHDTLKAEAAEWLQLSEDQRAAEKANAETERIKAEEEAAKLAAEKAAAEAAAKAESERKAAEAERKGYNTGITFDQLSRTPDSYKGKKVMFTGEVVQVLEEKGEVNIRLATKESSWGGYMDDIVFTYFKSSLMKSRILEGDVITVYGVSKGLHSYQTIWGQTLTLPLIEVSKIDPFRMDTSGKWRYDVTDDDDAILLGYEGEVNGALTIPDSLDGHAVVEIGTEAFYLRDGITAVTIPYGVVTIGDRAFRECGDLTAVTISDSVEHIGDGAFARCYNLSGIEIPKGVVTMGMNPFYGCNISSYEVAPFNPSYDTVDGVLYDRQLKTLVSYPHKKDGAEYTIPEGTESIATGAFLLSSSLQSIIIPDGVVDIGEGAFELCSELTSVSIPSSVTDIGEDIFRDCKEIVSVTGVSGSVAEQYAKEYDLPFVEADAAGLVTMETDAPSPAPTETSGQTGDSPKSVEITF